MAIDPAVGADPTEAKSARAVSPLRLAAFRYLLGGQVLSSVGDQLYAVALPILLLVKGGGPADLGLVLAVYGVGRAATLTPAGWLVDRVGALRVMLATDLARAAMVSGLAVLAFEFHPPLWGFVVVAALLGAGEGSFGPGYFAITPTLVPAESLQAANSSLQGLLQAASVLAPVGGGLLVSIVDPGTALAVDAGTFVLSAGSLALIGVVVAGRSGSATATRTGDIAQAPEEEGADDEPAGHLDGVATPRIRQLWRELPLLRVVLGLAVATSLVFGGILEVGLPSLARGPLGAGATGYGALLAGLALGGLAGVVAASRVGRLHTGPVVCLGIGLQGLSLLALATTPLLGGEPGLGLGVALVSLAGFGNGLGNILLLTLFQTRLPEAVTGRVMGVILLANAGLYPVSTLAAGAIIAGYGVTAYLVAAGAFEAIVVTAALWTRTLREASLLSPHDG